MVERAWDHSLWQDYLAPLLQHSLDGKKAYNGVRVMFEMWKKVTIYSSLTGQASLQGLLWRRVIVHLIKSYRVCYIKLVSINFFQFQFGTLYKFRLNAICFSSFCFVLCLLFTLFLSPYKNCHNSFVISLHMYMLTPSFSVSLGVPLCVSMHVCLSLRLCLAVSNS